MQAMVIEASPLGKNYENKPAANPVHIPTTPAMRH